MHSSYPSEVSASSSKAGVDGLKERYKLHYYSHFSVHSAAQENTSAKQHSEIDHRKKLKRFVSLDMEMLRTSVAYTACKIYEGISPAIPFRNELHGMKLFP